jgi:excisionase family DNA binding protein
MAVRHLFDTSPHSIARSRGILGASRSLVVSPAHLVGMTNTTSHPTEFESILTLSELAARLGVTAQTIYDLRSQGRGPHGFRIGRELKFRASEVDAWLRRLEEADARPSGGGGR